MLMHDQLIADHNCSINCPCCPYIMVWLYVAMPAVVLCTYLYMDVMNKLWLTTCHDVNVIVAGVIIHCIS